MASSGVTWAAAALGLGPNGGKVHIRCCHWMAALDAKRRIQSPGAGMAVLGDLFIYFN